ncbi:hypothetical protein LOTGIDRAFT_175589 [Lottia gigantea]|uniref:Secreted protein n=1 Tax=Lottia gigantea TaxID=225164 RepID=V4BVV9_LOTGI|nr:hypothetical protein LOTGIDRAFT_175589 [Lottia gigantea]ESO93189.1 hypothetical protein LOTGIDRAFT_175589 [Lottia gigantea]
MGGVIALLLHLFLFICSSSVLHLFFICPSSVSARRFICSSSVNRRICRIIQAMTPEHSYCGSAIVGLLYRQKMHFKSFKIKFKNQLFKKKQGNRANKNIEF